MPHVSIRQFRALVDSRARAGAAYRELARRPHLAAAMRTSEWVTWPPATQPRANA